MGIELGWAGEKWVGAKGPGIGGGVRGAVVASYHTYAPLRRPLQVGSRARNADLSLPHAPQQPRDVCDAVRLALA